MQAVRISLGGNHEDHRFTTGQRLRDDFRNSIRELRADIFAVERARSLTKGERKGTVVDAPSLYNDVMLDAPQFQPSIPLMSRAITIARKARIAVYDCVYVAPAEREGCELITADKRLINALGKDFPFVIDLATLP